MHGDVTSEQRPRNFGVPVSPCLYGGVQCGQAEKHALIATIRARAHVQNPPGHDQRDFRRSRFVLGEPRAGKSYEQTQNRRMVRMSPLTSGLTRAKYTGEGADYGAVLFTRCAPS